MQELSRSPCHCTSLAVGFISTGSALGRNHGPLQARPCLHPWTPTDPTALLRAAPLASKEEASPGRLALLILFVLSLCFSLPPRPLLFSFFSSFFWQTHTFLPPPLSILSSSCTAPPPTQHPFTHALPHAYTHPPPSPPTLPKRVPQTAVPGGPWPL